jgi:hypothetical protein
MAIDESKLEIWRESLAHLRYLSDEVWKRFQFFFWLQFAIVLLALGVSRYSRPFIFIIPTIGIFVSGIGRYILKRNRIYYLQMLAKKSLLEDELGFYSTKFSGTEVDLAFPWRLAPEAVIEIKKDLDAWVQKSIRAKGTIARWQFFICELFIGIYIGIAISFLMRNLRNL